MSWEPTYISNNVTYDDNDPDKKTDGRMFNKCFALL